MVYARLKDGITVAPRLYGRYLYPGVKTWIKFEDHLYEVLKSDDRLELLDQEEMTTKVNEAKQQVDDLVTSQWRSVEKRVAEITDVEFLKQAETAAKSAGKTKVAQVIGDRIEEITAK